MKKQKSGAYVPQLDPVEFPSNVYDDGNIPEIDLPGRNVIPDEVPRQDGPGGEPSENSKR